MTTVLPSRARCATLLLSITTLLSACGGGGGGHSAPLAQPASQSISFAQAPELSAGASAVVRAVASSGLPVRYVSRTPLVCSVKADSGQVDGLAEGNCTIDATQDGNAQFQAAPTASLTLTVLHDRRQAIVFGAVPALPYLGTATVQASASSGLPVHYSSQSPALCSVDAATGVLTGLAMGDCVVAAHQDGDAAYDPAPTVTQTVPMQSDRRQTITFAALPALPYLGSATVQASASSGLTVAYVSSTPGICTVTVVGRVTDLAAGDCIVVASQPGNQDFDPAPAVSATLRVAAPQDPGRVPSAPRSVTAELGSDTSVLVHWSAPSDIGSSPLLDYVALSQPAGLSATVSASATQATVTCPLGCAGYGFVVKARNAAGSSASSSEASVLTRFAVTLRFFEPDTQPNDSIFTGTFTLNSTTRSVSALSGRLTESMTGTWDGQTPMIEIPLVNQLSSVDDGAGGLLVSSFALATTNTFQPGGFADTVNGVYYGYPAAWSASTANSFITIWVNPNAPGAALGASQINRLVYGDCAEGGMMGIVCMTGIAGGGTMGGYPVSQTITRQP